MRLAQITDTVYATCRIQ